MPRLALLSSLALFATASGAGAADLTVLVTNVRNDRGDIVVAVCDAQHFLGEDCAIVVRRPAHAGTTEIPVGDVPPGTYGIQLFHDENRNDTLDENFLGVPTEGVGLSNDPPLFGMPDFSDCAVAIGAAPARIAIRLRYFL